ncbi:RHS repeat domain-containing protein [Streptomyces gamaensis]|uniref:RHS repeat domain-containing protein n=1 Tax=Streptomyces gamaensis TaxID=1763542 RepID=A0ABW0ZB64_9ACTN
MVLSVGGGMLSAEAATALSKLSLPGLEKTSPVPVSAVKGAPADGKRDDAAADALRSAPKVSWPEAGSEKVKAPGGADVQVLDRSAAERLGVDGVLLAVRGKPGAADGSAQVRLDYSDFAHAYGGDWASRLTLVQLPGCALESPGKDGCDKGTPLPTKNDTGAETLTADVPLDGKAGAGEEGAGEEGADSKPVTRAPRKARSVTGLSAAPGTVLLAATAAPAGGGGDFRATPLSPSGKWAAGGSAGGFAWTYELQTPEVPGGLEPDLDLGYSSQSLDGRTAATNNQANWVGDGWSLSENYVERRYKPCVDDMKDGNNKAKNGELCWGGENATLSLNGKSHVLVKDDKSGAWKFKDDDGTRVELLKDTGRGNGDDDGEHWRITTPDGVQYYFGYNRLPGWDSGRTETNSTWNVPVYGNHKGEPCHKDSFAGSSCNQAWRWNLDYVVDTNDNAMAYYYAAEANHYARNADLITGKGTPTAYARGGHLVRIEYGLRAGEAYKANGAAAKVEFTTAERCLADSSFDCAPSKMTMANARHWPDVPVDQNCKAGEDCKSKPAPTFWTTKRLTKVTTKVLQGDGYRTVDTWDLRHQFPDPGDGSTPALWLAGITRTGDTGDKPQALPEVTFNGQQLANRVDTTGDGIPPLVRYRVYGITTETGGTIGVTYSAPDCKPGDLPDETSNSRRCYPVYWTSPDAPGADHKPVKDWFHKYVVTQVLEHDNVGGAPAKQTDYSYLGGAAWARSEDEFTKPEHRTHSEFRGYAEVRTQVGNGSDGRRLDSRARYFRGLEGAQVADYEGGKTTDHPAFAGMTRAEISYDGDTVVESSARTPWLSDVTASHARPGLPALTARMTGVREETGRSPAKDGEGGWHRTRTERAFDDHGMVVSETDHGDIAKSGDETCTTTTYARNPAKNILGEVASRKTVAAACGAGGDLISEKRTYYDGSDTLGAAPAKGNATREDENDGKGTGFVTVVRTAYDPYGRPVSVTDAENRTVTTAYTPAAGAAPTRTVATNPLGHTLTTELDPGRGLPTAETDANGKRTDAVYDSLGRLVQVWEPGRDKGKYPDAPSASYTYAISRTAPPTISTTRLRGYGSAETSHAIYDGLLRERQSQEPSSTGTGRVITEKQYDSRGLEWKTYDSYYATGDPEPKLVAGDDTKVPAAVRTEFDGAGRPTASISLKYGDETKRVTTAYEGNRTTVVPPKGGTATTTVTDALGRTVEKVEYTNADRTTSQSVTYAYDRRGNLTEVTDAAGNVRSFGYDMRGRPVRSEDPDQGTVTTAYDALDRPVSTTDARGTTLSTGYDPLGRKVSLKQGDNLLADWTYDTVAKGELAQSRRVVDGNSYTQKITGYTDDYQPTGVEVTVPASEGALAGSYRWEYTYNNHTGLPTSVIQPAIGDLPAERVVTRYDRHDEEQGLTAGGRVLVNSTTYDPFGRALRTEYNSKNNRLYRSWAYDEHTGQLSRVTTDRSAAPQRVDDTHYSYDPAGNVTGIRTETGQDKEKQTDTQCFTTDALQRLTHAWTAKEGCTGAPSRSTVGGPSPYWLSYSYDALGNRTKEVRHDVTGVTGDTARDVTRTYHYAKPGGAKPHALTSVETRTGDGKPQTTDTFGYDPSGNTTARDTGGVQQKLTWDPEGELASVEEKDGTTTRYTYDADGERLLRKDASGTTLYLPGDNELRLAPDGKAKTGTRYYRLGGETVAARADGKVQFLFDDHHGTATTAIDGATQEILHRTMLPFGEERGGTATAASWPGERGFVGGTRDGTGLTQLGARAYDPKLGRFLSVDPMTDFGESQRMNAYAYANNNPVSFSDPDGLFFGKLWNKAKKTAKKAVKKVTKVAKKVVKTVKRVVKKTVRTVKKAARYVAKQAKKIIRKTISSTKKFVRKAVNYTKKAYRYVKKKTSYAVSSAKRYGKSVGKSIRSGTASAVSGIKKGASAVAKAATSYRTADILGKISTLAGAAAMVPTPFTPFLAAVSLGTGVASAAIHLKREGLGGENFQNAAVGLGLGLIGGGAGRLAGKAAARMGARGVRFIEGGLKAALPEKGAVGGYMRFKYDAMPVTVGASTTDWRQW